jgi:alpha-mannosidase
VLHDIRWTSQKIRQRLELIKPLEYCRRDPLPNFSLQIIDGDSSNPNQNSSQNKGVGSTIPWGSYWGGANTNFQLRTSFKHPKDWDRRQRCALFLPIGIAGEFSHPEALIYIDGDPIASCDRHHQEIPLPASYLDGKTHEVLLAGWTGNLRNDPDSQLLMRECSLVEINQTTRNFIALARVALGAADFLSPQDPARAHLFTALDLAFKTLDTRDPLESSFYESIPAAHKVLKAGIGRSGVPLDVELTAIGHAHLDLAWLWPLSQTRQKAIRTIHNVLSLMDHEAEFRFTQSQPQLYEFIRQDAPDLFKKIQDRVHSGQWELIGGMWVEADCNISGGEALVRQLLMGRRYFREHFGEGCDTPVLWLPDVFGYAWNLPQLMKSAGLDSFFSIKLGWNEYNRIPYDSFWWEGLDGTRVLTHFSTTHETGTWNVLHGNVSTYNAKATPGEVINTWNNFQQKDSGYPGTAPPLLMCYGHGDGGGGPTEEMVENIRELGHFPSVPKTEFGTAREFFVKLKNNVGDRLPTWSGELYLEYHRGTYTTQARNKRANRKSEFLLHDAEFLAAAASALVQDFQYPFPDVQKAWELVCLNQFHDILPGSSIHEVYEDSLAQYEEIAIIGKRIRDDALDHLTKHLGAEFLVVNPTSFTHTEPVLLGRDLPVDGSIERGDGSAAVSQPVEDGTLIEVGPLSPYSLTSLHVKKLPEKKETLEVKDGLIVSTDLLENAYLRVEFNKDGDISRIFDKEHGREVMPPGTVGNHFQAFEDRPRTPDAWEIDVAYEDRCWSAEPVGDIHIIESGPLRAAIRTQRKLSESTILQDISLGHASRRIDFKTTIQWEQRHTLLKVAFPVDILSPSATYEIQFGNIERPTHRNTSWDWAKFESCAQKWVDLSEGDYGVSLLNDCKYGHDIRENVLRLTLLRGTTYPDPTADQGEHRFTYSLLPHIGPWGTETMAHAYALNDPILVRSSSPVGSISQSSPSRDEIKESAWSFMSVDQPHVVIETIKKAEDGDGIIVRMYESQRVRGLCRLISGIPLCEAQRINLLEEELETLDIHENVVQFQVSPYEIIHIRLVPA